MRFFLRINSCNEKTPNRGLTKIAPGCNPVERKRNPRPSIPEAAGFERARISIEGMRDEFWKERSRVLAEFNV